MTVEPRDASRGRLFIVSLPIGNFEDLSFRAKRVLGEVDIVAVEDTRRFGLLAAHHGIKTKKKISFFKGNETKKKSTILGFLEQGLSVALVSDAGTPIISDPGQNLVRDARAIGVTIDVVPGPSALTAAIAGAGFLADSILYKGFLPRQKNQRAKELNKIKEIEATLVFFESPRRLAATLMDLKDGLHPRRQAVVIREITKTYEEFLYGTLSELSLHYEEHSAKGEIVIVVDSLKNLVENDSEFDFEPEIRAFLEEGLSAKDISSRLSDKSSKSKRDIYQLVIELQNKNS